MDEMNMTWNGEHLNQACAIWIFLEMERFFMCHFQTLVGSSQYLYFVQGLFMCGLFSAQTY